MTTIICKNMSEISNHFEQKKPDTKECTSVPSSAEIIIFLL